MILSAIILNDLPLSLYRHIEIELRTKREAKRTQETHNGTHCYFYTANEGGSETKRMEGKGNWKTSTKC